MRSRSFAVVILVASLCASASSVAQSAPRPSSAAQDSSPWRLHPQLTVEGQTGVNGFTGGRGAATHLGPSWQARVGLHLFEWLSFGAVYAGSYNAGRSEIVGSDVGVLGNGGYVSVSLVAPSKGRVHPYAGVGIGYGWNTIVGSGRATSPLHDDAGAFVPMGFGADFEITEHLSIGPQFQYQRSIGGGGGDTSSNEIDVNEGDSWNLGVSIGWDQ